MRTGLSTFFFAYLITNIISGQNSQSVFVEGLGLGTVYSLDYDVRFSSLEKSGAGMRIGAE